MTAAFQEVAVRRLQKVAVFEAPKNMAGLAEVATAGANLMSLGYTFNSEAVNELQRTSVRQLEAILEAARELKGVSDYKPMYPNFPQQVIDASDAELFTNAIMHYLGDWVGLRIMPAYDKNVRSPLTEQVELVALGVAREDDFRELAKNIVAQGQPFSATDLADLEVLRPYVSAAKTDIKENAATLAVMFPELDWTESFKTVTDVLRLAVALSAGDVSLASNTKFKLSRPQRRQVLRLLDAVLQRNDELEDFVRHLEKWKRLTKTLHYREAGSPAVVSALSAVQAGDVETYNSKLEAAISAQDYASAVTLLSARPGVFARRLQEVLKKFPQDKAATTSAFEKVAAQVSIPVLVQMYNLFTGPVQRKLPRRAIMTKGTSNITLIDNSLIERDSAVVNAIKAGLEGRNKGLKVFLKDAESESRYAVPLAVRSASSGLRALGRGSRIKLPAEKDTVRLFMHWRDLDSSEDWNSRVDLDLSAMFANDSFSKLTAITYYNLRDNHAYHSGDITSAPDGAAEFVDVNIPAALEAGWRYVLVTVYSYSRQKLSAVPEAWAGAMYRSEPNSGEIFEPATVAERFDLTVDGMNATPLAFDLKTRELVWLDSAVRPDAGYVNNVAGNENTLATVLQSFTKSRPMTVKKLVKLTTTMVDNEEDADLVLASTDTEKVLGLLTEVKTD